MERHRELHRFFGGLQLPAHKELSNGRPIATIPLPDHLILPLSQHIGTNARPIVGVGQRVRKGELLAEPDSYVSMAINAPTSGVIAAISQHNIAHAAGIQAPCLVLEPDGLDEWIEQEPAIAWETASLEAIQRRIRGAGIVGLGGAGFPADVKLREGRHHDVELLVINGVECEPYLSCDDRLMRERAYEVIAGAQIMCRVVDASNCVIAVEDDMPEAYEAIAAQLPPELELVKVPAIYPAGGEKQLIKVLTGIAVTSGGLPIQTGIVMHNVATAAAVYRSVVLAQPLISRVVTVTGAFTEPQNLDVLLGTPVANLVAHCGLPKSFEGNLIMGGPMMGIRLTDWDVPVTKTTNCILALEPQPPRYPQACISCGNCVEVCPVSLQPQALYEFARAEDFDTLQDYHLFDCIECGCCAFVCPSHLPLVDYYRYAKFEIEALESDQERARLARLRFETRNRRLEVGQKPSKAQDSGRDGPSEGQSRADRQAYISAAVQRVRAKQGKRFDDHDA